LELEGRYEAMLSHEPKNYALLTYDDTLILRGVAFRSSRAEPFGEVFLRKAIRRLMAGDVAGVREIYVDTLDSLRRRELETREVSSRVRLTKSPERYLETRETRRELPYEAMLASGRAEWSVGDRVRVYRTSAGSGRVVAEADDETLGRGGADRRDYDVEHYARVLQNTYAARLARAFTAADFESVFADPDQISLFPPSLEYVRPILSRRSIPAFGSGS
jgi:DNA polymerase I